MIMEFIFFSSTASRMSDLAANEFIEDSTTIPETPPSQGDVEHHDPIDDFLQSSDNDIPEIGGIPIVPVSPDGSGDIFNSVITTTGIMNISSDIPIPDVMNIEDGEDEGIAIELVDRADGGIDSDDYVSGTPPPITVNMKRIKHMNHGHDEMNGQQGDDDEDGDQSTRPVLKRRRLSNTMLMPPPVSAKNSSAKGKSVGSLAKGKSMGSVEESSMRSVKPKSKHVIKLSSNPPSVRPDSLPGAWMHDNGYGSSSGGYISIRKGKYISSCTSASVTTSTSTTASASTSMSASTSGSASTSTTVSASTSSQIDSGATANGEASSGTIYE
jgi:hypothetical protein